MGPCFTFLEFEIYREFDPRGLTNLFDLARYSCFRVFE